MGVRDFRDLEVYQAARQGARDLFTITKSWPSEERYRLIDQIRGSSRSIGANVAEAWGKRRYRAAFVLKLSDADAEARETQSWLDSAWDCSYLSEEQFRDLTKRYDGICGMLVRMMQNPDQWGLL